MDLNLFPDLKWATKLIASKSIKVIGMMKK